MGGLYKHRLNGKERPKFTVPDILGNGENVLKTVVQQLSVDQLRFATHG